MPRRSRRERSSRRRHLGLCFRQPGGDRLAVIKRETRNHHRMNVAGDLKSLIEIGNCFNLLFGTEQQTKNFQAVKTMEDRYDLRRSRLVLHNDWIRRRSGDDRSRWPRRRRGRLRSCLGSRVEAKQSGRKRKLHDERVLVQFELRRLSWRFFASYFASFAVVFFSYRKGREGLAKDRKASRTSVYKRRQVIQANYLRCSHCLIQSSLLPSADARPTANPVPLTRRLAPRPLTAPRPATTPAATRS